MKNQLNMNSKKEKEIIDNYQTSYKLIYLSNSRIQRVLLIIQWGGNLTKKK